MSEQALFNILAIVMVIFGFGTIAVGTMISPNTDIKIVAALVSSALPIAALVLGISYIPWINERIVN